MIVIYIKFPDEITLRVVICVKRLDYSSVSETIHSWLHDFLQKSQAKGFVVGLSGGIDSSVVGVLCRQVTPNTLGLILPCHSSPESESDARRISSQFAITTIRHDLTPVYESFLKVANSNESQPPPNQVALGNIKARLRMLTLYFNANRLNYLVAGCGNGVEVALGYFTKYGDGGADLWPIGDLLKQDVRGIATHLGIPRDIIEKPPTADLWPGQTDEEEIGASYDLLDKIIGGSIEGVPEKLHEKITRQMAASLHKNPFVKRSPRDLVCPIRRLYRPR